MTPVPEMDERLRHAVQGALKRPPESLYDLKKVKALNDFCYFGDPYYQEKRDGQEPGDFSAIGQMENLHTLVFGTPRSQRIPAVLVADFSFLAQCKKLKKLDLRWTNFTDCTLLLQLSDLKHVHLPPKKQLAGMESLEILAERGVSVEFPPEYVAPVVRQPAQGSEPVQAVVAEIKRRTALDCWQFTIQPDVTPGLFDSKFGGLPYWPPALPYPADSAGEKLILLVQINLEQIEADTPLPKTGLLQFFVGRGDNFGADWGKDAPSGFQVVWHKFVNRTLTQEQIQAMGIPTQADLDSWPVMQECAVTAQRITAWMGPSDGRFDALFAQVWEEVTGQPPAEPDFRDFLEEPDRDYVYEQLWSSGHRLLGWPHFEQFDPREEDGPYGALLFQLDSDWTETDTYVMWADGGVGNFFISPENLKRQDFSDVFYTWDCG